MVALRRFCSVVRPWCDLAAAGRWVVPTAPGQGARARELLFDPAEERFEPALEVSSVCGGRTGGERGRDVR